VVHKLHVAFCSFVNQVILTPYVKLLSAIGRQVNMMLTNIVRVTFVTLEENLSIVTLGGGLFKLCTNYHECKKGYYLNQ
jgi:hypothetical protein